jgi:hypothetical protein
MKKTLLSLMSTFAVTLLMAQNCTPDGSFTDDGVYPDSATNLAVAYVGQPYSQTITVIAPADTCVEIIPGFPCTVVPIDSIVVESVTGLPPGFTIMAENFNDLNFQFPGGSTSCMIVQGTAQAGDEGTYPILVSGTSYATVAGLPQSQPYSVDYYFIEVVNTVGLEELDLQTFSISQNSPNPVKNYTTVTYNMPNYGNVSVQIRNILGEMVINDVISAQEGKNTYRIDATNLSNGLYFYQFSLDNKVVTKKFIVNK